MMTVRFPDGTSVQYNTAIRVKYEADGRWNLYSDAACAQWIASVQATAGVIVEGTQACKVYNPTRAQSVEQLVDAILAKRSVGWSEAKELARLKKELCRFNARRGTWKQVTR